MSLATKVFQVLGEYTYFHADIKDRRNFRFIGPNGYASTAKRVFEIWRSRI